MLLRCRRLIELLGRSGLISEQEGFPLVGGDSRLRPFYTPQVFVVENHPKFEQQLWKFVHNHL